MVTKRAALTALRFFDLVYSLSLVISAGLSLPVRLGQRGKPPKHEKKKGWDWPLCFFWGGYFLLFFSVAWYLLN